MMGRAAALCIGHASWDLCMLVDIYPPENTKTQTEQLIESGGGPAANAAWLLRRWGIPTAIAALVGDDDYGCRAIAELQQAGIDCSLIERCPAHLTPVSFILANSTNGSRTIVNRRVPARSLQLPREKLTVLEPRLLLFDGHELEASYSAMEAFPGALTVLDAGSLLEGMLALAQRVDYLICSERFAGQVTGDTEVHLHWQRCLKELRELNNKVAIVTLGEGGVIFDDGREKGLLAALPVRAVDSTAAGDIFHGAFAFALLRGESLIAALRFATVAAGLSVQRFGGRTSVPELSEVRETLATTTI
jgi:sulfofructose kinase